MRILHTSDWHLGRSFHRVGMLDFQAQYVDHLLQVVESERVDLVVVAGDVYDRALPPVDAVRLADETLVRLAHSRAKVVLTSGNHDSAQRLGFSSRLIDAAGVHIRATLDGVGAPVLVDDKHGPVAVYGLPYLDPHAVAAPWELAARSHEAALSHAMGAVRADLAGRQRGTRSMVLAHAFVAGGRASDSERDIAVGGIAVVPAAVFDGVDYVALGHLHGRQTISDRVRYSGSPLAYSFSEAGHRKGSWLVELDATGSVRAEFVDAPVPRRLARLRGTLEQLLTDPGLTAHEDDWLEVTLTDADRPPQPMERLRRRFRHALVLAFETAGGRTGELPPGAARGHGDHEIARDFLRFVTGREASGPEGALLDRAIDACCDDPDLDPAGAVSGANAVATPGG